MEGIDPRIEVKWIEKRIQDIQKGLLHAENVGLPEAEKLLADMKAVIDRDKKALSELRARKIRLGAQIEEEKKKDKGEVK
jgi:F0F1-type ATP synthase membrane subunit b/b'